MFFLLPALAVAAETVAVAGGVIASPEELYSVEKSAVELRELIIL